MCSCLLVTEPVKRRSVQSRANSFYSRSSYGFVHHWHESDESQPKTKWERLLIKNATNSCLNMKNNPHMQHHRNDLLATSSFPHSSDVIDEQHWICSAAVLFFQLIVANMQIKSTRMHKRAPSQRSENCWLNELIHFCMMHAFALSLSPPTSQAHTFFMQRTMWFNEFIFLTLHLIAEWIV